MFLLEKAYESLHGDYWAPIALYSSEDKAGEYVMTQPEDEWERYNIIPFTTDEDPDPDDDDEIEESNEREMMIHMEDHIAELIDHGFIEQFVENDGTFSYEATQAGLDFFDRMKELLKDR